MKQHETRRYEVLLQLRPAETLPPAYEMDLPLAACLAEDGRETQAYDTEARKTHLFGKPVGNIRLQVQAYDVMTLVLIVTETMEDASDAIVETAGEPVRLPQLAGRMPETAWKMVVANDIDAALLDFCVTAIENMKSAVPALAKIKDRLRKGYSEIHEIYDPHYARLEIYMRRRNYGYGGAFMQMGFPCMDLNHMFEHPLVDWKLTGATCTWKDTDGSYVTRDIDVDRPMGTILLEAYGQETKEPYRGELSSWAEGDARVFMKHGVSAGSEWARAIERMDATVIDCKPEKTVREHLEAAMKVMQWE